MDLNSHRGLSGGLRRHFLPTSRPAAQFRAAFRNPSEKLERSSLWSVLKTPRNQHVMCRMAFVCRDAFRSAFDRLSRREEHQLAIARRAASRLTSSMTRRLP